MYKNQKILFYTQKKFSKLVVLKQHRLGWNVETIHDNSLRLSFNISSSKYGINVTMYTFVKTDFFKGEKFSMDTSFLVVILFPQPWLAEFLHEYIQ